MYIQWEEWGQWAAACGWNATSHHTVWHTSSFPSMQLGIDGACVSVAVSVVGVDIAGCWCGICWHGSHYPAPPPLLHPASSSSHLLLDLLFSCPVVVGVHDGCWHAVDVAGVDMAASTCHGWNQRVLVDLDATCGWCGGGWHGASMCRGRNQRVLVDLNATCSRLTERGCECPHPSTRGEGQRDSGCGGNVKKWIVTQVTRVMISHTSLN